MNRNVFIVFALILSNLIAQPGRPGGPGSPYGERMKMMSMWKLTEYLELDENQGDKFFPSMRVHRDGIQKIQAEEIEIFVKYKEKISAGEEISTNDVSNVLDKIQKLEQKRLDARLQFVRDSDKILGPTQQMKLLMFEGHMKKQIYDKMGEYQKQRKMKMRKDRKYR